MSRRSETICQKKKIFDNNKKNTGFFKTEGNRSIDINSVNYENVLFTCNRRQTISHYNAEYIKLVESTMIIFCRTVDVRYTDY